MSEMDSKQTAPDPKWPSDQHEIGLLDLAVVLALHKRLILILPLVAAAIAAVISLMQPNIYTATTRILAPQNQPNPALLTQADNVAGIAAGIPGLRSPSDLYVGMLKSRTVADNLVRHHSLAKVYGRNSAGSARAALQKATNIPAAMALSLSTLRTRILSAPQFWPMLTSRNC
jgi:uncharacterized protein involved in exopolysaccharide biosynthesis